MGLIDRIRRGEYVADSPAPRVPGRSVALAEIAQRVVDLEDCLLSIRDFLDHAPHAGDAELAELIRERPQPIGDPRADALLAGVAEHLSATRNLPCPAWVREPERFLDRFWFVSDVPGFRAVALAQSPMALKRRGIFWPSRSLERV